jgi:chromosome segregation ATPase
MRVRACSMLSACILNTRKSRIMHRTTLVMTMSLFSVVQEFNELALKLKGEQSRIEELRADLDLKDKSMRSSDEQNKREIKKIQTSLYQAKSEVESLILKLKDKHIEVQTKHAEIEKLKNDLDLKAKSIRASDEENKRETQKAQAVLDKANAEVERLLRERRNTQTQVQAKHEELERAKSKLANFESLQEAQKGASDSIQTMQQAMMECKLDIVELQQRLCDGHTATASVTQELERERADRQRLFYDLHQSNTKVETLQQALKNSEDRLEQTENQLRASKQALDLSRQEVYEV